MTFHKRDCPHLHELHIPPGACLTQQWLRRFQDVEKGVHEPAREGGTEGEAMVSVENRARGSPGPCQLEEVSSWVNYFIM